MKANKYNRQKAALLRLEKRINSGVVSQEFLDKVVDLSEEAVKKETEKYWKRRKYELSRLQEKGIKNG